MNVSNQAKRGIYILFGIIIAAFVIFSALNAIPSDQPAPVTIQSTTMQVVETPTPEQALPEAGPATRAFGKFMAQLGPWIFMIMIVLMIFGQPLLRSIGG